jgi:hypothetical protein
MVYIEVMIINIAKLFVVFAVWFFMAEVVFMGSSSVQLRYWCD